MVAYQESEHRRDGRPHGQALLRTCRLRQQPHRDAGERRRGGRMGDPRHGLRDAVGRTDAADERQGRKHLPQPRLLPHAVLRHSAATRHRKRFFAGRPLGRIHRPLDRVRHLEQDLHRHLRHLHRRTRIERRERQLRRHRGPRVLRQLVHPPRRLARHALRTEAFEPPVRTGAAVGPQRRDRHHRRRRGVRHTHLLAVRARRLHHRQIPPHAKDQLFRLRVDRRQNQEIRRLGRQHEGLPVGVQRRRHVAGRTPRAQRLSPRSRPDSRRTFLEREAFAGLLAGESLLEPLRVVQLLGQGE